MKESTKDFIGSLVFLLFLAALVAGMHWLGYPFFL